MNAYHGHNANKLQKKNNQGQEKTGVSIAIFVAKSL